MFIIGEISDVIYNCSNICDCYYKPKRNVSRIICSKLNINELHKISSILSSFPIELILKNNLIDVLPNLKNLYITALDISNNMITTLDTNLLPTGLKVICSIIF